MVVGNEEEKVNNKPENEELESEVSLDRQHKVLYRDFILKQREFQRQRETIITWKDDENKDFALSFQDKLGARNTWFSICFIKGL